MNKLHEFIHIHKCINRYAQRHKHHYRKDLLRVIVFINLNDHTFGFYPQTQKLELLLRKAYETLAPETLSF